VTGAVAVLRDPATIRARCAAIAAAVQAGRSRWFALDTARLEAAADRVARVTRARYPDLAVPYHSRWRHFEAGGVDRNRELAERLSHLPAAEQARARIDLAFVSVLTDAGAGADWAYTERETGRRFARSEGLAIAGLRAFLAGAFSSDGAQPLRVDARALAAIDAERLARLFQVRADNPLLGLEGRAQLLRRLGAALAAQPQAFGADARPGRLFDALAGARATVAAADILRALLEHASGVWLTPSAIDGVPLGDVWRHPFAGGAGASAGWVPLHKLSQWLAYSLFEPFEWAGVRVTGGEALTALAEYRNGGLLLDCGAIVPRAPEILTRTWQVCDEPIVEWRALTVHLIDALAARVRARLGRELPLACVLEGGTWAAGRQLAEQRRGGRPPLNIASDGTVF
jgi:hypothetical protein